MEIQADPSPWRGSDPSWTQPWAVLQRHLGKRTPCASWLLGVSPQVCPSAFCNSVIFHSSVPFVLEGTRPGIQIRGELSVIRDNVLKLGLKYLLENRLIKWHGAPVLLWSRHYEEIMLMWVFSSKSSLGLLAAIIILSPGIVIQKAANDQGFRFCIFFFFKFSLLFSLLN